MITEERKWRVDCDAAELSAATEARGCWGCSQWSRSPEQAVTDAKREGFEALPGGRLHLCRECVKPNLALLGGEQP